MTKKISQLPAATSVDTNDEFVINQDGTTKKLTTANQWDFANVNIDGGTIDGTAVNATTLTASGDALIGTTTLPADLVHGRAVVASSASGGDFVAFKPTNVNVGDRCGAFVIGNNDTDGANPHYVGMWGKAASTNGSMNLHFAAGRAGYENDTPEMTLASGGRVGIGTTSPATDLHIQKSGGAACRITNSGSTGFAALELVGPTQTNPYFIYKDASRNLVFQDFGTERMRIDSSGNVGVGTTAPGSPLDVNGDIISRTQRASFLNPGNTAQTYTLTLPSATRHSYLLYIGLGAGNVNAEARYRWRLGVFIPVASSGTGVWTEISTGNNANTGVGDFTVAPSGNQDLVITKTAGSNSANVGMLIQVVAGGSWSNLVVT